MIQPNELRINNLVKDNSDNILSIRVISKNEIVTFPIGRYKDIIFAKSGGLRIDIFPIPITGELLINFGFGRTPNNIFYLKWFVGADKTKTIEIEIVDDEVFASFYIGKGEDRMFLDIKYVHQLQNIYHALTGKELEITL